jgi:hypothetical protein
MKLKIKHNGFHGLTSASIVVDGNPGDLVLLTQSQINKLKHKSCGMEDCRCGESLLAACEIPEPWSVEPSVFIQIPDSGAEIEVRGNYPHS